MVHSKDHHAARHGGKDGHRTARDTEEAVRSPFAACMPTHMSGQAPLVKRNGEKLSKVLEVSQLVTPLSWSLQNSPRPTQPAEVQFIDRYRTLLPDEHVQAALAAASKLAKSGFCLPKLHLDRSQWSSEVAASLPLRALPLGSKAGGSDDDDEDGSALVHAHTAGGKNNNLLKAERLVTLVGNAMDRFLKTAAAAEATEKVLEQQMLALAAQKDSQLTTALAASGVAAATAANTAGNAVRMLPAVAALKLVGGVGQHSMSNQQRARRSSLAHGLGVMCGHLTALMSQDLGPTLDPIDADEDDDGPSLGGRGPSNGTVAFGEPDADGDGVSTAPRGGAGRGFPHSSSTASFANQASSDQPPGPEALELFRSMSMARRGPPPQASSLSRAASPNDGGQHGGVLSRRGSVHAEREERVTNGSSHGQRGDKPALVRCNSYISTHGGQSLSRHASSFSFGGSSDTLSKHPSYTDLSTSAPTIKPNGGNLSRSPSMKANGGNLSRAASMKKTSRGRSASRVNSSSKINHHQGHVSHAGDDSEGAESHNRPEKSEGSQAGMMASPFGVPDLTAAGEGGGPGRQAPELVQALTAALELAAKQGISRPSLDDRRSPSPSSSPQKARRAGLLKSHLTASFGTTTSHQFATSQQDDSGAAMSPGSVGDQASGGSGGLGSQGGSAGGSLGGGLGSQGRAGATYLGGGIGSAGGSLGGGLASQGSDAHLGLRAPATRSTSRAANASDDPWTAQAGHVVLDDEDDETQARRAYRIKQGARPLSTRKNHAAPSRSASNVGKGGASLGRGSNLTFQSQGSSASRPTSAAARRSYISNSQSRPTSARQVGNRPASAKNGGLNRGDLNAAVQALAPLKISLATPPSRLGVSLLFLQTFAGLLISEHGQQAAQKMSTAEVVQQYVKPRTAHQGCRFLDLLPEQAVGQPRYLVSHRWGSSFLSLVTALTRHCHDLAALDPERVFLWLDFMAVSQNTEYMSEDLIQATTEVSHATQQTLVVLDEDGLALNRTWVLYEMWCAVYEQATSNKLVVLMTGTRATGLARELYRTLDITRSETTKDGQRTALLEEMRQRMSLNPDLNPALNPNLMLTTNAMYPGTPDQAMASRAGSMAKIGNLAFYDTSALLTPGGDGEGDDGDLITTPRRHGSKWALSAPQTPSGADTSHSQTTPRKKVMMATLLQMDLSPVNKLLRESIHSCCVREAKRAAKMLLTAHASPVAYIYHSTQAAVLYHLEGHPSDAESTLRNVLCYQLANKQGSTGDWEYVVLALVDALEMQGKMDDALMVARKTHEAAERLLARDHRVTSRLGLRLWDMLTACGQHGPAEALANSLHIRLDRQARGGASTLPYPNPHSPHGASLPLSPQRMQPLQPTISLAVTGSTEITAELSPTTVPLQHGFGSMDTMVEEQGVGGRKSVGGSGEGTLGGGGSGGGAGQQLQGGVTGGMTGGVTGGVMEPELAAAQLALGKSLLNSKKWRDASAVLTAAWSTAQALLGGGTHPRCIQPLMALGHCAAGNTLHGDAVSWYTQARALMVRWYGRESRMWVDACCDQAASLQALGDLKTAEKMMRRLLSRPLRMRFITHQQQATAVAANNRSSLPTPRQLTSAGHDALLDASSTGQVATTGNINNPWDMDPTEDEDEDRRLAGKSFEVRCRLVEVLAARCLTLSMAPPVTDNHQLNNNHNHNSSSEDHHQATLSPFNSVTPRVFKGVTPRESKVEDVVEKLVWSSGVAADIAEEQRKKEAALPEVEDWLMQNAKLNELSESARMLREAVQLGERLVARYRRVSPDEWKAAPTDTNNPQPPTDTSKAAAADGTQSAIGRRRTKPLAPPESPGRDGGAARPSLSRSGPAAGAATALLRQQGVTRAVSPPRTPGGFGSSAPTTRRTSSPSRVVPEDPSKVATAPVTDGASKGWGPTPAAGAVSPPRGAGHAFGSSAPARGASPPGGGSPRRAGSPPHSPGGMGMGRAISTPLRAGAGTGGGGGSPRRAPASRGAAADGGLATARDARSRGTQGSIRGGTRGGGRGGEGAAGAGARGDAADAAGRRKAELVVRKESWRHQLLHMAESLSETGRQYLAARCYVLAHSAHRAAAHIAHEVWGPGCTTCVKGVAAAVNVLMTMRCFHEARQLLNTYRQHPYMSVGAKELLRIKSEPLLSVHAFKGTDADDAEMVSWALQLGAMTMMGNDQLLVRAALLDHLECVRAITAMAPNAIGEEEKPSGMRALATAAYWGHSDVVEYLLTLRTIVDAQDADGRTALWHASNQGRRDCVLLLLERGKANPNTRDMTRWTPLMCAASRGHLNVAQLLIEKKAQVDVNNDKLMTPLMLAAGAGAADVVDLLLRCRARNSFKDMDGETALMYAAKKGKNDVVSVLLSYKCDLNTQDNMGQTALTKAAAQGHAGTAEHLMLAGLEPEDLDEDNRTPLHHAAVGGHASVVSRLILFIIKGDQLRDNARLRSEGSELPMYVKYLVDKMLAERVNETTFASANHQTTGLGPPVVDEVMRELLISVAVRASGLVKAQQQQQQQLSPRATPPATGQGPRAMPPTTGPRATPPTTAPSSLSPRVVLPNSVCTGDQGSTQQATTPRGHMVSFSGTAVSGASSAGVSPRPSATSLGNSSSLPPLIASPRASESSARTMLKAMAGLEHGGANERLSPTGRGRGSPSRLSMGGTLHGEEQQEQDEEEEGWKSGLEDLQLLLGYASQAKVKAYTAKRDKFGSTAADLALENGHAELGRILRLFSDAKHKQAGGVTQRDSKVGPTTASGSKGVQGLPPALLVVLPPLRVDEDG